MTSSCEIASKLFRDFWKLVLKYINENNGEQEKEWIIRVRVG